MAISEEDFQRVQTSLIELRNQNYSLEDENRKQKHALGSVTAKANVLEQELQKAEKVIQKSKKTAEVQQLVKDNESLQLKLRTQEEDFRHQNQTLMQELAKLVAVNEELEGRVKGDNLQQDSDLLKILESERKTNAKLVCENQQLREQQRSRPRDDDRLSPHQIEVDVASAESLSVSFKKHSISEEPKPIKNDCTEATDQLESQLFECQEKLKKKQESLLLIQEEKEKQFQDLTLKLEQVKEEKDAEILSLKQQSQRLQGQLNHGHSAFSEFKEKKNKEIKELQDQLQAVESQAEAGASLKSTELQQKVDSLTEESSSLKAQNCKVQEERESLSKEVQSLLSQINLEAQEKLDLESKLSELQSDLDETTKTSNNRKALLDEMAVTLQTKTDVANESIAKLEEDLESVKLKLQEKESELETTTSELKDLVTKDESAQNEITGLRENVQELEQKMEQNQETHNTTIGEIKESNEEEVKFLKADHDIAIRDLTMQLEISNAQKTEFEERVSELLQEVKDVAEDKKIADKKGQGLIKDLKRQLLAEKQRNETLSEKLDKMITEASSTNVLISEPRHENESEDAKSNGSWSIYSDSSKTNPKSDSNNSLSTAATTAPVAAGVSSSSSFVSSPIHELSQHDQDYAMLLGKIESLQKDKFSLEQKAQMLEASAAAMADDLVRKSDIILHYCMEGKANILAPSSNPSNATPVDGNSEGGKDKLKKVIDIFKNPEQHSISLKSLSLNNNQNVNQERDMKQMQRMLEETLTKNMHLQRDLEHMSQEVVRLSKQVCSSPT